MYCARCEGWAHVQCLGFSTLREIPVIYHCKWCRSLPNNSSASNPKDNRRRAESQFTPSARRPMDSQHDVQNHHPYAVKTYHRRDVSTASVSKDDQHLKNKPQSVVSHPKQVSVANISKDLQHVGTRPQPQVRPVKDVCESETKTDVKEIKKISKKAKRKRKRDAKAHNEALNNKKRPLKPKKDDAVRKRNKRQRETSEWDPPAKRSRVNGPRRIIVKPLLQETPEPHEQTKKSQVNGPRRIIVKPLIRRIIVKPLRRRQEIHESSPPAKSAELSSTQSL